MVTKADMKRWEDDHEEITWEMRHRARQILRREELKDERQFEDERQEYLKDMPHTD